MSTLSRREFLKTAGAGVAAAALGGQFISLTSAQAARQHWDRETDTLIVGYGGAGAAAAIAARDAGADVLVLEKRDVTGGTTAISGGVVHAADTYVQRAHGIEGDTAEKMARHWLNAGRGFNDEELVLLVAEQSADVIDWLTELGAHFPDAPTVSGAEVLFGSDIIARVHRAYYGNLVGGPAFFRVMADAAEARGAEVLTSTAAQKLIVRDGEVIGLLAERDRSELYIRASKAVILTTGGFTRNREMLATYCRQGYVAQPLGLPGATGDGHRMAFALGADAANMSLVLGNPGLTLPGGERAFGGPTLGILVNEQGRRFVDELAFYDWRNKALADQYGSHGFVVFDEELRTSVERIGAIFTADLQQEMADGTIVRADTFAELAGRIGVPSDALEATVVAWNDGCAVERDHWHGRTRNLVPLTRPPFYALEVFPTMFDTKGGAKIDRDAHVIDVWGDPIRRLYAAGQVTGGTLGEFYPGSGSALTVLVVFGRIAGRNAAGEAAWT